MQVRLAGQLAVVTGASSGIGRALSLALAAEGAALSLIGRDEARLQAVAAEAQSLAPKVMWHRIDLSRCEEIDAYARLLENTPVGVLIHSAGLYARGPHAERPYREYADMFAVNVSGPMYLTQRLLPGLKAAQGQIVFINSTQGLTPSTGVGMFAATQHALKAMADTLRDEVKPEVVYYPVLVRTSSDALVNKAGQRFPIVPGMVTTVDIRTGRKSVWDYLIKPFNRAREALRER